MSTVASTPLTHAPGRDVSIRLVEKYFYSLMSLLIVAVVTYGFSHTVDQNLVHAAVPRPAILWVHGFLFSGWLAFFMLQSVLVRVRSVNVHRTLGWFGAVMGAGVFVIGVATTFTMTKFHSHVLHESDMSFVLVPFWDMACFAAGFGLSIYWRKKPDYHLRLALIATCALTAAGFGRFPILPPGTFYAGVDLLILLGVARDLLVDKRVNAVYRVALPVLVAGQVFVMYTVIAKPEYWVQIATAIAR